MEAVEASLSGTFRILLVLLAVWWLLRMVRRIRMQQGGAYRRVSPDDRSQGEVRIEPLPRTPGGARMEPERQPTITDADYEEVK